MKRIVVYALGALAGVILILNWTYGRLPTTPHASGEFLQLNGLRVRYLEHPGIEPTVLLLHGQPGTAEDYEYVTPSIHAHRTIAIDRPGYGFSTRGYFSFDRQLKAVEEVLDRLGVRHVIVVGHSYGGTVALGYAESHPARLTGLVLLDAGASCTHVGLFERSQARLVKFLELPVLAQLSTVTFSQLLRKASGDSGDSEAFDPNPVNENHRRRLLSINLKHGNLEAYAGEALAANGVIDRVNKALGSLNLPVTVIQGDHDKLVDPRCGRGLASSIRGARLEMVSGGHMTPYTHPADVAAAIQAVAGEASGR